MLGRRSGVPHVRHIPRGDEQRLQWGSGFHSADFPTTPGAFDRTFNGSFSVYDGAVVRLDPAGSTLMYSTFLGGTGSDIPYGLALDSGGNASITGTTGSPDFPTTPDALDRTLNGSLDAFLAKL